jgi:hypothetical protein
MTLSLRVSGKSMVQWGPLRTEKDRAQSGHRLTLVVLSTAAATCVIHVGDLAQVGGWCALELPVAGYGAAIVFNQGVSREGMRPARPASSSPGS